MTAAQARDAAKGLTFDDFWAGLMEIRETLAETARRQAEAEAAWEARMAKLDAQMAETEAQMKETDKRIGRLGGRIGDLIEHFAAANVLEKFHALGCTFNQASQNFKIKDKNRQDLAEVDIFLENGDFVMAVEVKTTLTPVDVTEHLRRMEVLRAHADSRGDKRKILGAIAAALAGAEVRKLALDSGFYVLEQQGDNVRIAKPAQPRAW